MKKFLPVLTIASVAFLPTTSIAQDFYLAFKAPADFEFLIWVGKTGEKKAIFDTGFSPVIERRDDGFYYYQIPTQHVEKLGEMTKWCVNIIAPPKYFEQGGCFEVDPNVVPDDGIYRNEIQLK